MNKLAIFGASAVMAALPVAGVFAADSSVTDTVIVNVPKACTLEITAAGEHSEEAVDILNGKANTDITGAALGITCNDHGGWYLTAIGGEDAENPDTDMTGTNTASKIATGTTLDGSVSNWAFKATTDDTTNVTIQGTYDTTWAAIPGSATTIAKGTGAVENAPVQITYGVGISATQAADTYTGHVTYTVASPANDAPNN